jgi:UDP-GlcNAc3NAcA epimerase
MRGAKLKPIKIISIVGARPQFIKAMMVSRAIKHHNKQKAQPQLTEILIHTGQHYDYEMSQIFFDKMKIAAPHYQLGIGSGTHAEMIGRMLPKIEEVVLQEQPDWTLIYGDTNSTLAGAMVAAKLNIPVAHVEAGLRSYNRRMPEEINRVLTDRISNILFCPTETALKNLAKEGITDGVYKVGDVMNDAFLTYKKKAVQKSKILQALNLRPAHYYLATVHRQENTDDPERLRNIFSAFEQLAKKDHPFVIPLHPRTRGALRSQGINLKKNSHVRLILPLNYLDMIALELQAAMIFTDSGGMQKEAFFARVPCITLRDETEWVETVEAGWNFLTGARKESILRAFANANKPGKTAPSDQYGKGNASQLILEAIIASSHLD